MTKDAKGHGSGKRGTALQANGDIHHDGEKVGRAKVDDQPGHLRLADIEIQGKHQGKGIGSAVIRQLQARAQEAQKPMVLTSDAMRGKEAQGRQRALYERLGFEKNTGPGAVSEKVGKKTIREEYAWHPEPPEPSKAINARGDTIKPKGKE